MNSKLDRSKLDRLKLDREDQAILAAWQVLESGDAPSGTHEAGTGNPETGTAEDDAPDDALVREYTELLGLMAYELEPAVPSAETRTRILAMVSDDGGVVEGSPEAGRVVGSAEHFQPQPSATPQAEASEASPFSTPTHGAQRGLTWLMAAMLGLCLLGLGFLAGQTQQQQSTIAQLTAELDRQAVEAEKTTGLLDELTTVKRRFDMVTRIARQAYPVQAVANEVEGQRGPEGTIYVCGAHQRWYLNIDGLDPAPPGKEYRLWFLTEGGTVAGGRLDVEDGATAELEAQTMPNGTQGFSVTLEDASTAAPTEPQGLTVLLAEDSVSL